MYLKQLVLRNSGPIEHADIEAQFNQDGTPKPIVFVGRNGAGKSFALAHIVSSLIEAKSLIFDDADVERGKIYKLRSQYYIKQGADYSTGEIYFDNDLSVHEAHLTKEKQMYEEPLPNYSKWDEIEPSDFSHYTSNFLQHRAKLETDLDNSTYIYFPPNRFEDPAWLNEMNLVNKTSYTSINSYTGFSNRPVINYAPMRDLQSWLLDLLYDSYAIERKNVIAPQLDKAGSTWPFELIEKREGPSSRILDPISLFLRTLFGKSGVVSWSVGSRNRRKIGFKIDEVQVTDNLFQLSTGQSVLLDLFLTIIRDFDLSHATLTQLSDVDGIVIVDEIDLHLHSDLQHDVLPKLIQLFPKVQFIVTTHSPLFVMGMEHTFSKAGFQLVELPSGEEIEVERFSEFEDAYQHMKNSVRFENEIEERVRAGQKHVLYLEGKTDIDYLTVAAKLLDKTSILEKFEMVDAVGYAQLDKIWDTYKSHLGATIQKKWILLYDCDARKSPRNNNNIYQRIIPQRQHKVRSGIENLFSDSTLERAAQHKPAFIDIIGEHTVTDRGVSRTVPESWNVNRDEKRNLCDWLCENGSKNDFEYFCDVFEILEEVLQN